MIPIKGEIYKLKTESISSDGNGVCRLDSFAVFVPMSVPGDTMAVRIKNVKARYATGEIEDIIEESPHRTEPVCKYYGRCGGCQIQNTDYKTQIAEKTAMVENAVRRIGGIADFSVDEFIECDKPFRYRNKVIFFCDDGIGLYQRSSHSLVGLTDCRLANEKVKNIIEAVGAYAKECGVPFYSEKTHKGVLRLIFVRNNSKNEFMVVLSVNAVSIPNPDMLISALDKLNVVSLYLNIDKRKNSTAMSRDNRLLYGRKSIREELLGIRFEISPESFFQVNYEQTKRLYQKALEFAAITKDDTVMDLYCGIGTISLAAAGYAKEVIGVEAVEEAVCDARDNARNNGIENAGFLCSRAENIVPKLIEDGKKPDIVIMDPPRAGSDNVTISAILKASPKRVVYVSCNPATLARDIRTFADNGYAVSRSAAVDMFPQTMHVETVVLLSKLKSSEHIEVELSMDELDLTAAEKKATYQEIKDYVLEHYN